MSRAQEMEMALAAAPPHLRAGATVYVLEKDGFVLARQGANGFTCAVNRDHPLNLKPTCWDREGSETILPKVLRVGELLMKGTPLPQINAEIKEGFRSGKFVSPRRPGIAYMLSDHNRDYNPQTGKVDSFPPHVMFYAPNLTNADIGSSGGSDGLPFVAYQGPHGYMIMMAEGGSKMTPQVPEREQGKAFTLSELERQREQSGKLYLEFLKNASMRAGIYALGVGAEDTQQPHEEDEVYYVLSGHATFRVGSEDRLVQPGSILFVAAHAPHKFHSITEPIQLLVFFGAKSGASQ
jgi:mannose-6-phosphate isomerase-like protein (cupin superfamily)